MRPNQMKRIDDYLTTDAPTLSVEFFPPKDTAAEERLGQTLDVVAGAPIDFVSVTYGAAGSDRHRTVSCVESMVKNRGLTTAAHLTCVGHTVAEVDELLSHYSSIGVRNILALGGDPPAGGATASGDFAHASDLVAHIKANYDMSVGVAAHPEGHPRSRDLDEDREYLAMKLSVSDFALTQFFFDVEMYRSMIDDLRRLGCVTPVIPGVIPISNLAQVERFAELGGATLPSELRSRLEAAQTPEEVKELGIAIAVEMVDDLIQAGAPGIHLYTLNQPSTTRRLLDALSERGVFR